MTLNLGTTDSLTIRAQRRLIEAARAFAQAGKSAPGAENPDLYRVRSGQVLLPKGLNWVEATEDKRTAFTDHAAARHARPEALARSIGRLRTRV